MDRGSETRLGVSVGPEGASFRLHAPRATGVDLCLFDDDGGREAQRVALERDAGGTWRAEVAGVGAGRLYGYRVSGPYEPVQGHRFNPAKLLVDPRAGAVTGKVRWNDALRGGAEGPGSGPDERDSAVYQARSVVVDTTFDWQGDRPPATSWGETVLYECHVRGMTRLHPEIPEALRGTYLGLAAEPVVEHLKALGVTAIELMPVQHFASERHLAEQGLENYWGYSPLAWFAPHAGYARAGHDARGEQVEEFQTMVRKLHRAGLEVILDMVFNHTVEGDAAGATLSLRGVDNALYYLLSPDNRSRYVDFTGCGNTVHAGHSEVAGLIQDCLRHWVEVFHVDGFRFDLATTLGRERGVFSSGATLLEAIGEDPVLSGVKLIAEPWDVGPGGYRLGSFPPGWAGWNDRFRDAARSFWRGDGGQRGELARRVAGSADLLASKRRGPLGGVNYVTCHDGFTLEDLVSYERKHNEANGEDGRDGREQNLSRNWGTEGPTESSRIQALRDRAKRNLLATLALSYGVPMLAHGDELGRTQQGNNNAYCQDGWLTWVDWSPSRRGTELLDFLRRALSLRREMGIFAKPSFPRTEDLIWLHREGRELTEADWHDDEDRLLGIGFLNGDAIRYLFYLNAGDRGWKIRLPAPDRAGTWREVLRTDSLVPDRPVGGEVAVEAYTMIVLKRVPARPDSAS